MFEATRNAFLPELLLDISRAKKCRKASFRKKFQRIEPACAEQNVIRAMLTRMRPKEMKPIEDPHFGVDYLYNGTTIDQKFSFGALGENTIKVRIQNRELMNNSEWTMIINSKWETEVFETAKLAQFVKKNWCLVQRRLLEKRHTYSAYAVRLEEFYSIEEVQPIRTPLTQDGLYSALEKITLTCAGVAVPIPSSREKPLRPPAPINPPHIEENEVIVLK
ncbi:Uncharacterised protein [uncultured archaeon]|nr:Uncharacterised protein [uncultured archaeon]